MPLSPSKLTKSLELATHCDSQRSKKKSKTDWASDQRPTTVIWYLQLRRLTRTRGGENGPFGINTLLTYFSYLHLSIMWVVVEENFLILQIESTTQARMDFADRVMFGNFKAIVQGYGFSFHDVFFQLQFWIYVQAAWIRPTWTFRLTPETAKVLFECLTYEKDHIGTSLIAAETLPPILKVLHGHFASTTVFVWNQYQEVNFLVRRYWITKAYESFLEVNPDPENTEGYVHLLDLVQNMLIENAEVGKILILIQDALTAIVNDDKEKLGILLSNDLIDWEDVYNIQGKSLVDLAATENSQKCLSLLKQTFAVSSKMSAMSLSQDQTLHHQTEQKKQLAEMHSSLLKEEMQHKISLEQFRQYQQSKQTMPNQMQSYQIQSYQMLSQQMQSYQMQSQQMPSQQMPSQQMPSQQMQSYQMPSQQMQSYQMPSQQMQSYQMPSQQMQSYQMPSQQMPLQQMQSPPKDLIAEFQGLKYRVPLTQFGEEKLELLHSRVAKQIGTQNFWFYTPSNLKTISEWNELFKERTVTLLPSNTSSLQYYRSFMLNSSVEVWLPSVYLLDKFEWKELPYYWDDKVSAQAQLQAADPGSFFVRHETQFLEKPNFTIELKSVRSGLTIELQFVYSPKGYQINGRGSLFQSIPHVIEVLAALNYLKYPIIRPKNKPDPLTYRSNNTIGSTVESSSHEGASQMVSEYKKHLANRDLSECARCLFAMRMLAKVTDRVGNNLFHLAVLEQNVKLLKKLFKYKSIFENVDSLLQAKNHFGQDVALLGSKCSQSEIVNLLRSNGLHVDDPFPYSLESKAFISEIRPVM